MKSDTIAAIATPMTNSGIGIIRISGNEALNIIEKIFKPKKDKKIKEVPTYTAHYGHIFDNEMMLDECIVLIMKAPHSYTTEDVVEINCHGGVIVMKKILEAVIKAGARPAEPGEFTKRAFLNGRIDLSKAEAVMDLIHSRNEFAMTSSLKQLDGVLGEKINLLRKEIIHSVAFIESALDDPEHYSVDGFSDELKLQVEHISGELNEYLKNADNGRILKEGIQTVIVGKPNAGKSSVLNVLLGEERAIVTDIAGTTRDTLEESIQINGIPLNIIDTAGIRETEDFVEKIGVDKAKELLKKADLVLYVVDSSTPISAEDQEIIELIKDKQVIVLLNKADLESVVSEKYLKERGFEHIVVISARERTGMEQLYEKINQMFFNGNVSFNDEIYITNMRHKNAVSNALDSLKLVLKSIEDNMPEDFFSIDLMDAYEQLGYITGESVGEDLVNEIFAEFCMGK
ncbi:MULTISPECIES: tRNA uridine-5-carboxymethylaminomethyl(34) synthesis GTPase MnmE [Anaerostipes]|uniref:tRNA uridine-5-carboxymethylaminomethyl(34) synthesis GTPase MnmE n=1 Tax=Anaerostipes TaxID=207244 RepID=UPI000950D7D7|nr:MULTISPECIES: tRNA uridine-5-carboxymethylaminomethyl(34) synthesis GTPase MnmE [Anaerostipes]MCI5623218.1 tRNA uridine-5-carboxymethylaminomethyl(34) synthesis GTPase MnmE [Anaerostipes sp.]MDY2725980.1 tRNA uridine-5-carboxymethylaminomethyl(34) synthesis GTPase MnmE [Anaerostipes faecalis]OLR59536.1 tRNA uridine-5-carboxymethylaminomethyl(34) synthesis GTPase MnmE [Anaerostipes sp. 494a]